MKSFKNELGKEHAQFYTCFEKRGPKGAQKFLLKVAANLDLALIKPTPNLCIL